MKKRKFKIEYQLKTASVHILWNSISTPLGLSEWFADGVTVNDNNEYTFTWDHNDQTAFFVESKQNDFIRFRWEEDEGKDYFFEMKIEKLQVTGELALIVTDFTTPDDKEDLILLWNKSIEVLRRKTGI
ncbi:MAG: START-like domain-containing protein [Paludibacter sp.]|nr:START-like domain-containing protein [Paludibacter sp.]